LGSDQAWALRDLGLRRQLVCCPGLAIKPLGVPAACRSHARGLSPWLWCRCDRGRVASQSTIASRQCFPHTPRPMIRNLVQTSAMIGELAASTKEAALKELLAAAGDVGAFPQSAKQALGKRLSEREAIGSTGLGNSVAVPHVKGENVNGVTLVMAR